MSFLDRLNDEGGKILESLKSALGQDAEPVSGEVREEILRLLASRIIVDQDRKIFPFNKITVCLQPSTKSILHKFKVDFMENSSLKTDIFRMLRDVPVQLPPDLEISIEIKEDIPPMSNGKVAPPLFELSFPDPEISTKSEIPELHLEIIKGNAEQSVYRMIKDCLLIGCLAEVQDREGRLVRKNNIVFPHEGNEINATVGNMHARIWFDGKRQEFCVMDESSRYGTRIIREGHTIEVPAENPRGVGLHSGDEICFGQACLRFILVQKPL